MADILILTYQGNDSLKREHNEASDSVKMLSYKTTNNELTDANLTNLITGIDANDVHIHDARYYRENEHVNVSTGASDAAKPIILDSRGKIDPSMLVASDLNHDDLNGVAASTAHTQFPLLDGSRDFTAIVSYDAHKTFSLDAQIVDKKYVDDAIEDANSSIVNGLSWKNHVEYLTAMTIVGGTTSAQDIQDDSETEGTYDFAEGEYVLSLNDSNIYVIGAGAAKGDRVLTLVTGGSTDLYGDREETPAAGDARSTLVDIPDSPAGQENGAIYVYNSTEYVKHSDVDWQLATGIDLSSGYAPAAGTVAGGISIEDAIAILDADIIAIQSVGIASSGSTITTSGTIGANTLNVDIDFSSAYNDQKAIAAADLSSNANAKGASIIGIEDANSYFTGTNVEAALNECFEKALEGGGVEYTASETLAVGDAVYISASNTVSKLSDVTDDFEVIGLIVVGGTTGQQVLVRRIEKEVVGVLTAATAGTAYYWTGTGLSTSAPAGGQSNIWKVGVAKNATDLTLNVEHLRKRP